MIEIKIETEISGLDRASCRVPLGPDASVLVTAHSRHGAIHALCRKLREANIEDQPWEVPGRIKGTSIYWMADHTVTEASGHPRTVLYSDGPGSPSDLGTKKPDQ